MVRVVKSLGKTVLRQTQVESKGYRMLYVYDQVYDQVCACVCFV